MPHRCGIFTVRPVKPNAVTQDEGTNHVILHLMEIVHPWPHFYFLLLVVLSLCK